MPHSEKRLVTVAAAALFNREGEVLLAQRPLHKNMGGLWEFPGGKLEAGESPEIALQRELREELGITVQIAAMHPVTFVSHDYELFSLLMLLYAVEEWQGEVHANEHMALAWSPLVTLNHYPMPPADIPLIPVLENYVRQRVSVPA